METLALNLQPFKYEMGLLSTAASIGQLFAGIFVCRKIRRQECTLGISSTPFVGGVAIGILMLWYSLMLEDEPMYHVNVAAIVLNLLYSLFYFIYSEEKYDEVVKPVFTSSLIVAALYGYLQFESPFLVEWRYGFLVTTYMLILMGNPLFQLKEMVANKDSSDIQLPLVLTGSIVNFSWLLYSIILRNNFTIIHHSLAFMLCIAQLILALMYEPIRNYEYEDVLEFLRKKQ